MNSRTNEASINEKEGVITKIWSFDTLTNMLKQLDFRRRECAETGPSV